MKNVLKEESIERYVSHAGTDIVLARGLAAKAGNKAVLERLRKAYKLVCEVLDLVEKPEDG
jgi:hypothetical protein